ncbi:reticulocyte-binding protein 2 homolog a isoform X17 [Bradysia coprophila]|uniref:reticulocyte-binding protein 2 homolog a isoform X17 n=1 Tax=Bradysia coprophila TaxID=38358 RepID=UPI00187DA460|nr:reticulocyte-binding protein 2 homolog a isoform X17 [Bradysia coprophila]
MKSDENNMASLGGEDLLNTRTNSADNESTTKQDDIRKPKEREDRLRIVKDRQNEERQRKLEELKNQAIAAQKYREQKEDERKRRMEELRHKELDRKQQVDERKKAIMDAERERREYILRKNQERDMRLETKKRHERGSIAFAFGSSTPRLLEPLDSGTVSPSQYWGHRRSTSISNVTFSGAPLSRRSSERELSDGPKKRATSAGGLDRQVDGSRSGDATPGSASRPGSAMSTSTTASGVIYRRSVNSARKPRPASIASTGMTASCIADISVESDVSKHKKDRPPLPKVLSTPRRSTAATPPSSSSMTASSSTSTTARSTDTSKRNEKRIPPSSKKASTPRATTPVQSSKPLEVAANVTTESVPIVQTTEIPTKKIQNEAISIIGSDTSTAQPVVVAQITEQTIESEMVPAMDQLTLETTNNDLSAANSQERVNTNEILLPQQQENEMTASMMKRIVTEEEAKAALAERRRLAREEAEKLAELERQRKEAEELAEQQRIAEEEENQRRLEEETLRLVEEQKKAEELRLLQAIEEAKLKEEEERKRKELEEHARIEREELERKAREEAEKLKIETAEKLRKEEKEREERRKRVEAIMSRTRKGGNATNTPNKDGSNNADQTSPSNSDLVKTGTDEHNFTNQNNVNMATYEMSVTNKENALMNSFSNLIEHQPPHPTLNIQEFNAQNAKTNGKSEVDATNDDNLIIKSAISNGNGHTDHSLDNELDSKKFSAVDNKTQEMITGQLIDINMDFNESSTPVNFNNNSLLTSTNLVTSDSPESKDLSLL